MGHGFSGLVPRRFSPAGERPPAEDFPPRLDAVPDLDTRGALTRLWDHLKKGQKQRLHGWFQEWADIEAAARWP